MKTKKFLSAVLFMLGAGQLVAQEKAGEQFPGQFSFVYPIGTHGTKSNAYAYTFSLNALSGSTGQIKGCEIGGILNKNASHVSGFQVAGIANLTQGNVEGVQIGGIYSKTDSVNGVQINGILSQSNHVKGLQIGGILNRSKVVNGLQIGLINISDTITRGMAIGLVNIVKRNRFREWTVAAADYLNLGISFKTGTPMFYTLASLGANFQNEALVATGFGIGHLHPINNRFTFQPELINYFYFPVDFTTQIKNTRITHLKLGLVCTITRKLGISLAPSLYWALKTNPNKTETFGYAQSPLKPLVSFESRNGLRKYELGYGLSIGLNFH